MSAVNPLAADLDHVLEHTGGLWEELRGQRLFVTGGTGFFGRWLLESFCSANDRLELGAEISVLTRRPEVFAAKAPHLMNHPAVRILQGDVRDFDFPSGKFSHIIHAATDSSATIQLADPRGLVDVIVDGTRRVLTFAKTFGVQRLLYVSSGGVYGPQPAGMERIPEEYAGGHAGADVPAAYGTAKRLAEILCAAACGPRLTCSIARAFAFLGPYLPLDQHFAVGNFIRDSLAGGPVRVHGDGTPVRSYLYAADLAVWLWTVLVRGAAGRAYNVGSDEAMAITEIAALVAAQFDPPPAVVVAKRPEPGRPSNYYVPALNRARRDLGLEVRVPLAEAVRRTVAFAAGRVGDSQIPVAALATAAPSSKSLTYL